MIDWDGLVLAPLENIFGEGEQGGEVVMYYPVSGAPYAIDGIFDEAWRDTELIDPLGATNAKPVLGTRLARLKALPVQDDQVYIPRTRKRYIVIEPRQDSHGSVTLILGDMS
ncbi:hypothetical protein HNP46_002195 [Pseudomonas nitritireducens]|uniref:Uncharacterized protein n=1 Tax=Pseudomonas nitroreducens TaxID=46680 RepID=A0A7W7P018_PSENT|nr:hypothetical protein [Pseudomonas nitritireducens]MBB4863348.1 hypothetical protein [Pseudomonas nitritireducens]